GSQLVGERLVVDKAVSACGRDGALIKAHGIKRTPFDPGNLGGDQRCTILEVLRTIRGPTPKLLLVLPKRCSMLGVRIWTRGLASGGATQARIEMAFRLLQRKERQRRGSRVPSLHLVRCLKCRSVIAGKEARLELSDPVVTFQKGARGL